MDGKSLTPQEEKLKRLKEILPEAFSEGKVDWEKLKATLGEDINFSNERYVLNWAGKSDAFKVLQAPSTKTLVPVKEESVNFDETKNIFIEGENLEVLKILQKSYFGKVKMIYIDPPYNTGNDSFIYPDKFSETKEEYQKRVGDKDEEGYMTKEGLFRKNGKENGQFHSNWLSMMYPRILLGKNLLRQDGLIFISIGNAELSNLQMLCNEIFGEENFIEIIPRVVKSTSFKGTFFSPSLDYVLCYARDVTQVEPFTEGIIEKQFPHTEKDGPRKGEKYRDDTAYYLSSLDITRGSYSQRYWVDCPDGSKAIPPGVTFPPEKGVAGDGVWRWGPETYEKQKHLLVFKESTRSPLLDENGRQSKYNIYTKSYLKDREDKGKLPRNYFIDAIQNRKGTSLLKSLKIPFSFPKPIELPIWFMEIANVSNEDIILDFFAGSGTTAHAVMELNSRDNGNRKHISIQLDEPCEEDTEAFKEGFKTISQIGKERIKRAGKAIEKDNKMFNGDLGLKIYTLNNSNFKQWQQITGKDAKALEEQMKLFVDPVSKEATSENMVYELLLKSGKDLNSTIEHKGNYYCINGNELVMMLEKATQEITDEVLKEQPQKVIALDRLFKDNDQLKTNTALQMKDAGIEFKTI